MYGSYGSYSSMSVLSAPMDITPSNLRQHDATCAFPSWPRRSSLSDSDHQERATSFLSDDDLFLSDPFEDDAHSVSSSGSASPGFIESPAHITQDVELMDAERHRAAMQREFMRQMVTEKERRRQQAMMKKQQRRGSPKKSPKSKLSSMTPIQENGE